jgi:hypothetical protein
MVYRRLADKLAACQGTKSVAAVAPRKRDANNHLGLLPCAQLMPHLELHCSRHHWSPIGVLIAGHK